MPGNTRLNTDPAIRALVHSDLLLETLQDDFLPDGLFRNVADFGDGTQIQIPTIGEMTLFDLDEGQPTPLSAMDTGTITLTITEHVGTGGYVSDELKEDGYKAMAVEAAIVPQGLRAIKERFETDLLSQVNNTTGGLITLSDPNTVNGFDHRWVAGATGSNLISLEDFMYAKLSYDKANVPEEGRLFICDPIVEATLNNLTNLVNVSNNPQFEGMVTTGFANNRRFVRNIFGFDIWVSNRLPHVVSEVITGGPQDAATTSAADAVVNVFMSVSGDEVTPFMGAMRRMPRVEGNRNVSERRDEFHITARWGFGVQRAESVIGLITDATKFK